jgi:ATP-dependent protease ClpP protease subunit
MERDNFMSPVEALNFGLIDKIITSRFDEPVFTGQNKEGK